MSTINLTINEFDLTPEAVGFIRTRHSSKQLAFALLFKYYQKSHQFINDLTKPPVFLINQAMQYLKERGIESFKEKTMTRIILDATNAFESRLFENLQTSLSTEIDKTIDMFNRIIRNVIHKSEKRVVRKLINDVKKVYGKDTILFNIAEICCEYLMHESIRQEIQEGLNVVELWNGVSKFIFYGRSGEISSSHEKAQTLSVLSLHLYEHVNPYGLFPLDLSTCLPHLHYKVAA